MIVFENNIKLPKQKCYALYLHHLTNSILTFDFVLESSFIPSM